MIFAERREFQDAGFIKADEYKGVEGTATSSKIPLCIIADVLDDMHNVYFLSQSVLKGGDSDNITHLFKAFSGSPVVSVLLWALFALSVDGLVGSANTQTITTTETCTTTKTTTETVTNSITKSTPKASSKP
ncbi:hypothetical protein TWF694_006197 [Orbilia ellipsospora]|uniref:Uncharacterized protein n=1 Tax=Orbilia ellipsospora TaxID=2528407 RepID=A0AAV9XLZ6_9PEZI